MNRSPVLKSSLALKKSQSIRSNSSLRGSPSGFDRNTRLRLSAQRQKFFSRRVQKPVIKKHKHPHKKSFKTKVIEFLNNAKELLLIICLIVPSIICFNIFGLVYMLAGLFSLSLVLAKKKLMLQIKNLLYWFVFIFAVIVFVFKLVIAINFMIGKGPISDMQNSHYLRILFESLGIMVSAQFHFGKFFQTFFPEIVCIVASFFLVRHVKDLLKKFRIENGEEAKQEGVFYSNGLWCYITVALIGITAIQSASCFNLLYLLITLVCLSLWAKDFPLEDHLIFKCFTYLAIITAFADIIAGYLLLISALKYIQEDYKERLMMIGVPVLTEITFTVIGHYVMLLLVYISGMTYLRVCHTARRKVVVNMSGLIIDAFRVKKWYQKDPEDRHLLEEGRGAGAGATGVRGAPGATGVRGATGVSADVENIRKLSDRSLDSHSVIELVHPGLPSPPPPPNFREKVVAYIFSPYFSLHICRIMILIWFTRYNTFESIPLLFWLFYSTAFQIPYRFLWVTTYLLYPYLLLNLLLYYTVNIPFIIPGYMREHSNIKYGILLFDLSHTSQTIYPVIEFLIMIITVYFFCLCLKTRKGVGHWESKVAKNEHRVYNLCETICIFILRNIDLGIVVMLYVMGLSAINIYHAGLISFFLLLLINPDMGRRCFIFLLLYIEFFFWGKYTTPLISSYLKDSDSWSSFVNICPILGFSTNIEGGNVLYRVPIKWQLIVIFVCVFIQYMVYQSPVYDPTDDQMEEGVTDILKTPFFRRNNKLTRFLLICKAFFFYIFIWLCYTSMCLVLLLTSATLLNFMFLLIFVLIICIHLYRNNKNFRPGLRATRIIWIVMLLYCAFVLFTLYIYQFKRFDSIKRILAVIWFPEMLSDYLGLIGYKVYMDYIWIKFLPIVVILFLSVASSRLLLLGSQRTLESMLTETDYLVEGEPMDELFFLMKMKPLWPSYDFIAKNMFNFMAVTGFILGIYWNLSIGMAFIFVCLASYYWDLHTNFYVVVQRKIKKNKPAPQSTEDRRDILESERSRKKSLSIKARTKYWKVLFLFCILGMILTYASRFITLVQEIHPMNEVLYKWVIYISFLSGFSHLESISPEYFIYSGMGYTLLLLLLMFEKRSQQWYLNRFGIGPLQEELYTQRQMHIEKLTSTYSMALDDLIARGKEQEEESMKSSAISLSKESELVDININIQIQIQMRNLKWKYGQKIMSAVKMIMEDLILFAILLACICKNNVVVMLYIIFVYLAIKYGSSIKQMIWLNNYMLFILIIQYILVLTNISPVIAPQFFPKEYIPHTNPLPWYLKIQFFAHEKEHDSEQPWAYYFSLGSRASTLQFIGIDLVTLTLSLLYFEYFCYSNYETSSMELRRRKIEKDSKYKDKVFSMTLPKKEFPAEFWEEDMGIFDSPKTKAASLKMSPKSKQGIDRHKLKSSITSLMDVKAKSKKKITCWEKTLYRKLRYFIYIYFHIFTLFFIFTLSTMNEGLMSVGYCAFCLYFFYKNVQFAQGEGWTFPKYLRIILQPYIFIDLAIHFAFQIPLEAFKEGEGEDDSWQKILGLRTVWAISSVSGTNTNFMILVIKILVFVIISIQHKIFSSKDYNKYITRHFYLQSCRSLLRAHCLTLLYNNKRIYRFRKTREEKEELYKKVEEVEIQMKQWNEKIKTTPQSLPNYKFRSSLQLRRLKSIEDPSRGVKAREEEIEMSEGERLRHKMRDTKRIRGKVKDNAGWMVKIYFWLHSCANHVLFKKERKLEEMEEALVEGDFYIQSRLEKIMGDCIRKQTLYQSMKMEEEVGLGDGSQGVVTQGAESMGSRDPQSIVSPPPPPQTDPQTDRMWKVEREITELEEKIDEFIKLKHLLKHIWLCLYRIIFSSTQFFCFFFLILNHIMNGSFLSLPYIIGVFCYALLEPCRPPKALWSILVIYAEALLALKYVLQLDVLTVLDSKSALGELFPDGARIGLRVFHSTRSLHFINYIIWDCMVILFIMLHQYILIKLGVLNLREIELENIEEATYRVNNPGRDVDVDVDVSDVDLSEGEISPLGGFGGGREGAEVRIGKGDIDPPLPQLEPQIEEIPALPQAPAPPRKENNCLKCIHTVFFDNLYMRQLFTKLKNEKPGYDMYISIVLIQLLIVVYLIFFYTRMAADYQDVAQAINFKQFSGEMVMFLLIQICLIVLDRYLYLQSNHLAPENIIPPDEKGNEVSRSPKRKLSEDEFVYLGGHKHSHSHEQTPSDEGNGFHMSGEVRIEEDSSSKSSSGSVTGSDDQSILDKRGSVYSIYSTSGGLLPGILPHEETKIEYFSGYDYGLLGKYLLQWILVILVHYFIFWHLANSGNEKLTGETRCSEAAVEADKCNDVTQNAWLALFYIIYCIYFYLSGVQISKGWPELRGSIRRKKANMFNSLVTKIYLAIPFGMELHVIMDWAFTKTSLDLFQWFKFEDLFCKLYLSKCIYKSYGNRGLGTKINFCIKFLLGGCGLILLLLLIIIPMILFSSLNPAAHKNNISGAMVNFGVDVNEGMNYFELFETTHVTTLTDSLSQLLFDTYDLKNIEVFNTEEREDMQLTIMQPFSDRLWLPTPQVWERLNQHLNPDYINRNILQWSLKVTFNRPYPPGREQVSFTYYHKIDPQTRLHLHNALSACNAKQEFLINNFNHIALRLLDQDNPQLINSNHHTIIQNLTLVLHCTKTASNAQTYQQFWDLYGDEASEGIKFLTISNKVTPAVMQYSAITFYISIVLVLFNIIRGIFGNTGSKVIFTDMPYTDHLLNLCQGVTIFRVERNLPKEGELYYTLIDIMRSPEMLKIITMSSLAYLKDKKRKKNELEQEKAVRKENRTKRKTEEKERKDKLKKEIKERKKLEKQKKKEQIFY